LKSVIDDLFSMRFPTIRALLTRMDTDTILVLILLLCVWFWNSVYSERKIFPLLKCTLHQVNNTCK